MGKKLVGFITASLPENNFTVDLALNMQEAGVDTLELGIPFSDPVADGLVIEKASLKALENGFTLKDLFEISSHIGSKMDTLWMGYMNPYFHYGMERFLEKGKEYNIQGSIIPDLPHEESIAFKELFAKYNQTLIDFVAPTDSFERIKKITSDAQKFIYMVAYAGITGSETKEDLTSIIKNIRSCTNTPIYTGFGVDENTAKEKVKGVDGVIVGSAFVKKLLDDTLSNSEKIKSICKTAKEIKQKINE
jgi:tryptophan synthase alpha chain